MSYREKTCPVCQKVFKSRSVTCGRVCAQKLYGDYRRERLIEHHKNNHSQRAAKPGEGVMIITEARKTINRLDKNIEKIIRHEWEIGNAIRRKELEERNRDIFPKVEL